LFIFCGFQGGLRGRKSGYNYSMSNLTQITIPTIATARLSLRGWRPEDAPELFQILREPGILRYFPNPAAPPLDRVERYIQRHLAHWQAHGYGHWAVTSSETGEVLGWMGLEYLDDVHETELAYLLTTRVWGKGLATEAAQAAVEFGVKSAGLKKIIGLVHPENSASARVLQKSGLGYLQRVSLWEMELDWYQTSLPA
jgi:[ribosomal protein S5]-alanine N-acetyltransferase